MSPKYAITGKNSNNDEIVVTAALVDGVLARRLHDLLDGNVHMTPACAACPDSLACLTQRYEACQVLNVGRLCYCYKNVVLPHKYRKSRLGEDHPAVTMECPVLNMIMDSRLACGLPDAWLQTDGVFSKAAIGARVTAKEQRVFQWAETVDELCPGCAEQHNRFLAEFRTLEPIPTSTRASVELRMRTYPLIDTVSAKRRYAIIARYIRQTRALRNGCALDREKLAHIAFEATRDYYDYPTGWRDAIEGQGGGGL